MWDVANESRLLLKRGLSLSSRLLMRAKEHPACYADIHTLSLTVSDSMIVRLTLMPHGQYRHDVIWFDLE